MEIVCTLTGTEGSNPSLSATIFGEVGWRFRRQPRQVRKEAAVTVGAGCPASLESARQLALFSFCAPCRAHALGGVRPVQARQRALTAAGATVVPPSLPCDIARQTEVRSVHETGKKCKVRRLRGPSSNKPAFFSTVSKFEIIAFVL